MLIMWQTWPRPLTTRTATPCSEGASLNFILLLKVVASPKQTDSLQPHWYRSAERSLWKPGCNQNDLHYYFKDEAEQWHINLLSSFTTSFHFKRLDNTVCSVTICFWFTNCGKFSCSWSTTCGMLLPQFRNNCNYLSEAPWRGPRKCVFETKRFV